MLDGFEKNDIKIQYILNIYIGDGNYKETQKYQIARNIWTIFKKKYKNKKLSINKYYLQKYIIYYIPENKNI